MSQTRIVLDPMYTSRFLSAYDIIISLHGSHYITASLANDAQEDDLARIRIHGIINDGYIAFTVFFECFYPSRIILGGKRVFFHFMRPEHTSHKIELLAGIPHDMGIFHIGFWDRWIRERQITLFIDISGQAVPKKQALETVASPLDVIRNTFKQQLPLIAAEQYDEMISVLEQQIIEVKKQKAGRTHICSICMDCASSRIIPTCGHTMCETCASKIKNTCPFCRTPFDKVVTIFF